MTQNDAPRESYWCESEPNLARVWSPSSFSRIEECPRKYQYEYVMGYGPKEPSASLTFGTYIHSALAKYQHGIHEGLTWNEAVRDAIRVALTDSWGWTTRDNRRDRFTLVRAIVWYCDKYRDQMEIFTLPDGRPAIEISYKIGLPSISPDGEPFILQGYMDNIQRWGNYVLIGDYKTSGNGFRLQDHDVDNQFTAYTMVANSMLEGTFDGVLIDHIQTLVTKTVFDRGFSLREKDIIEEWLDEKANTLERAQEYARTKYWPMNRTSCNKFGGCPYRDVCNKPRGSRQGLLDANFKLERREFVTRPGE